MPTEPREALAQLGHEGRATRPRWAKKALVKSLAKAASSAERSGRPVLGGQLETSRAQLGAHVVDGDIPGRQGVDPARR